MLDVHAHLISTSMLLLLWHMYAILEYKLFALTLCASVHYMRVLPHQPSSPRPPPHSSLIWSSDLWSPRPPAVIRRLSCALALIESRINESGWGWRESHSTWSPGPHTGDSVVMLNRDRETGCALQRRFELFIPRKSNCAALFSISICIHQWAIYIFPRIGLPISLQPNRQTDHGNIAHK